MLFPILASVIIISLISLLGVVYLAISLPRLERLMLWLVSFAVGTLLGDAFFHLLPELIENYEFSLPLSLTILAGMLLFFVVEKFVCWRHCHTPTSEQHPHPVAFMNLIGDAFHNFLDGMIVAASYLADPALGVATTIAVVFHEIPQEISDFGILVHGGLSRGKAILFNLASALTAIAGALLAVWLYETSEAITPWLIALTIGGFIYIATADLFPELKKETRPVRSIQQLGGIAAGLGVMLLLLMLE